jgi:glycosyltransferase involved in cell wall biosynthesis
MKHKLVIVTDTWGDINGVVRTLENTQKKLNNMGIETIIIEPSMFKSIFCPYSTDVRLIWNFWEVETLLNKLDFTHLHIATEGPLGLAARIWASHQKYCNYTTSYHTRFPEYINALMGCGESLSYWYLKWFHKKSQAVMVNTPSMYKLLDSKGFKNLVIWSRGVNEIFTPGGPHASLYEYMNRPILLNVGRICKEKNLEIFYDCNIPGTKIQVGDGPLLDTYIEKYPDVYFTGPIVDEALLAEYYRGADVFIFPSLLDTLGMVQLESIRCGTPVVGFNVSGPKDIIEPGITGYLATAPYELPQMIKNALTLDRYQIAKEGDKYSWDACTDVFASYITRTHDSTPSGDIHK